MKKIFLFGFTLVMIGCNNSDQSTSGETTPSNNSEAVASNNNTASQASTTIEWIDPVVQELGKAKEGQIIEVSWRFKNTGNAPLVISDVRAGCGCTVAEKPEEPIAPGKEGVIKAKFDTNGQVESQFKQVFVQANNSNKTGEGEDVLGFKIQVERKDS
ncbi:MAG TPA: DUF1573 domain-containing protein [Flavisolibacter sp.]|nr:DUF1573 domain-containing protein [Flavisolibacter sp.]